MTEPTSLSASGEEQALFVLEQRRPRLIVCQFVSVVAVYIIFAIGEAMPGGLTQYQSASIVVLFAGVIALEIADRAIRKRGHCRAFFSIFTDPKYPPLDELHDDVGGAAP